MEQRPSPTLCNGLNNGTGRLRLDSASLHMQVEKENNNTRWHCRTAWRHTYSWEIVHKTETTALKLQDERPPTDKPFLYRVYIVF